MDTALVFFNIYYFWMNVRSKSEDINNEEPSCRLPENCLLLPHAAPRGGLKPTASRKTNVHLLVEFGLQVHQHNFHIKCYHFFFFSLIICYEYIAGIYHYVIMFLRTWCVMKWYVLYISFSSIVVYYLEDMHINLKIKFMWKCTSVGNAVLASLYINYSEV